MFVDDLPRNPAGKVLKTKLREVPLPGLQLSSAEPTALAAGLEGIDVGDDVARG